MANFNGPQVVWPQRFRPITRFVVMMLLPMFPLAIFAAAVLLTGFGGTRPASHGSQDRSTLTARSWVVTHGDSTPLYTEEQATAGAVLFGRVCVECHEKTNVTSADFRAKWTGRPILDLYELIRTTMPDSNPGALSRDEYAEALAYILKLNGLPAGVTPVMPDSTAMRNVTLTLPPPTP